MSNFQFCSFKNSKCEPWGLFGKSKVCPVFVQLEKMQYFQIYWTVFGQGLDLCVQSPSKCSAIGPIFDRVLTGVGQRPDRLSTWPIFGQTLDRDLTRLGQTLDFPSSLCPTNQRLLVPNKLYRKANKIWNLVADCFQLVCYRKFTLNPQNPEESLEWNSVHWSLDDE